MPIPRIDHSLFLDSLQSSFLNFTGFVKSVEKLSRLSTQLRLVCRLWNAVIMSTPSLWVQLSLGGNLNNTPDILAIWLERSKKDPLHIELRYHSIDPQRFPDLTSLVKRWESLILRVKEEWIQQIPLSCARCLKFLCTNSPIRETPEDIVALIGTTPNLQSLCIKFEMGLHCAYTRSIDSIVNGIPHLCFCGPLLYCE